MFNAKNLKLALATAALPAFLVASVGAAQAITILPGAVSYEYFGLNDANNIATSSTVGSLNYTGDPGCGGTCIATTSLGADPSVSLNVNEVVYNGTGGGYAQAELGYYVEYQNATPGTYTVDLHASDTFSISAGENGQAYIAFGPAGEEPGTLNDFSAYTYQDTDCVTACSEGVANYTDPQPFPASEAVQMVANTPYFLVIYDEIGLTTSGLQSSASIDPTFTTDAQGGDFIFSPGVLSSLSGVPEPATWSMFLLGFGAIGWTLRSRRNASAATA
jgi:hypothetical protein